MKSIIGYAPVENGRLHYQVAGTGQAVLLIHGNAGDLRHWDRQFADLSSRYRAVRYDVRGFGKSSLPVPGKKYSDSSDIADLMDHLGVNEAHLVGWSFGSGVAFDFALLHPDRVTSLVSVGPWVNGYSSAVVDAFQKAMRTVGKTVLRDGPAAGANAFMNDVLRGSIFDEAAETFFRGIAAGYSWWAFTNPSEKVHLAPKAALRLDSLKAPTLLVTAEHDLPVCREVADFVLSRVPDARRVIINGTGHLMHFEKPEIFNAELLRFLGDCG